MANTGLQRRARVNSASWKSVTYCRTVGKETQKILFNYKNRQLFYWKKIRYV